MDSGINLPVLREGLIAFLVLIVSVCIHGWAQAFVADRLGDDTPARDGRLTINPAAHFDVFGTLLFPLIRIFYFPGGLLFGWGRPVALNPSNFRHRQRDEVLAALAGPGSNLVLAFLGAVIGGLAFRGAPRTAELAVTVIGINVQLALFNLIPLPPLDGGTILRHAVGMTEETYHTLARWSFVILLAVFWLPPTRDLFGEVLMVTIRPFAHLLHLLAAR